MASSLSTPAARTSYALGVNVAASLADLPLPLELQAFQQGMADFIARADLALSLDECRQLLSALQQQGRQQASQARGEQSNRNLREGSDFLVANQAKPGIVTTASGLQYEVVREGTGASPKADDTVTVHYAGRLLDGTEFDSSVRRGQPATFPLNGVIPGWTEGVQLMKVGGATRFFIPPGLGYGERGAGNAIGPNATLVFDVELLGIEGA